MSDLDLTDFLKTGSIANLDWLDVDEAEYRKNDTLPKQNLDIQPDLEALWARDDSSAVNHLVPNHVPVPPFQGAGEIHTMGDMSQEHGRLSSKAEEIRKVARLALIQSTDTDRFKDALNKRFDLDSLKANRQVLAEVLQERGLLGKLYIDANDFPGCHTGSVNATSFARKFAGEAKYVLAKTACGDCMHASTSPTGGSNCAVFHKEIQVEVPYTTNLADFVEESQRAQGMDVQANTSASPKERIKLAMLAQPAHQVSNTYSGHGLGKAPIAQPISTELMQKNLIQASSLVRKNKSAAQMVISSSPIVAFIKREMLKGLPTTEIVDGLKIAFNMDDLKKTRSNWEPLLKEAGLYGVIYSTQNSFDDCHVGADFLAKHNPGVRAIVAGEKCGSCIYNKGRCLMYGKSLVKEASELYTPETVDAVLTEHRMAGRLPYWEKTASVYGNDSREALKAIHQQVVQSSTKVKEAGERLDFAKAFRGNTPSHTSNGLTTREIVKQASKLMNEGLYGKDLLRVLGSSFDPRDLVAAKSELKVVLAEQGLQGIYYVDPTAYADYGKGCDEASRLHRARLVPYVKLADKCSSCVLQTKQGFCSKINKPLVVDPPYTDKTAQQREILASGNSTDNSLAGLVNNGASMVAEYQMQNGGMEVEVKAASEIVDTDIEFGTGKVRL